MAEMEEEIYSYTGTEAAPYCTYQVRVEPGVTTIPRKAFKFRAVEQVSLPEGLIEIGDEAFASCRLESITFPSTLKRRRRRCPKRGGEGESKQPQPPAARAPRVLVYHRAQKLKRKTQQQEGSGGDGRLTPSFTFPYFKLWICAIF